MQYIEANAKDLESVNKIFVSITNELMKQPTDPNISMDAFDLSFWS